MLATLFALGLAAAHGAQASLVSDYLTEWFWLSSIVQNGYLYISGGEFYENVNGVMSTYYQNYAYIIDLSQSWTNQTVSATTIQDPDGMIYVRQPILFYDKPRNKISRFGGWPYETAEFPSLLWSFTAGSTNAAWKNETSPSTDGLSAKSPGPFASANTYTNDTFYNYGGNIVPANALPDMTVLSGLVTRDLVAQDWDNTTATLPDQNKFRTQARMVHAPNFGNQGYLVMVGGEAPPTEESFYETGAHMVDMATITLYDIESQTWYTQTATGDIPPPRSEFCAVGAASSAHFDVFVYGGSTNSTDDLNNADSEGYLNVYALSLPAFRWFKSNSTTPKRRACHTCSVIGKSQMISIGGRLPSSLQALGAEQDPWTNGIGVFNMTGFEWVDHYDAAASAYKSPAVMIDYYQNEYQEPNWSNSALATVFAFTPTNSSSSSGNSSSSDGSGSSVESRKSNHTGAIVGGVVAGVAVIAIVLGGLWFWRRRQKQRARADAESMHNFNDMQKPPQFEAASTPMYEVDDNSRSEMDGSQSPHKPNIIAELPANDYEQTQPLNGRAGPARR